ncbi:MAG: hypothetical protein AABY32_06140 [Nanoarchaeota archaeon]
MAKKRSVKKKVEEESCNMYENHGSKIFLIKIASMAFILFLLTVWPWLNGVLLGVHWGIYLGIVILLMIVAMTKYYKKK